MKWLPVILLMLLTSSVATTARATERAPGDTALHGPTYAGGMMLVGGGVALQDEFPGLEGVTFGVAGRLVFMVGRGFRIGIHGGTGEMTYGPHESQFQYSHGSLSAEWGLTRGRFTGTVGFSGGYARYYILDKLDVSADGLITAREHEDAGPVFSPFVAFEFALTGRLRATLFIDYPWMSVEGHPHGGSRVGAGLLFVK